MKLYSGYVDIGGRTVLLPCPMTWMEIARLRFGPLLLPLAVGTMAVGKIAEGQAAKRQAENKAAMAKYNAAVSEQEAKQIEARSRVESIQQAQEAARAQSALLATQGTSGAVMTEGAPLLVQATQATQSELDNLMIGYQGQIAAARARNQAALYRMEAKTLKKKAKSAWTSSLIGAGATVLGGFYTPKTPTDFQRAVRMTKGWLATP